MAVLMGGLTVVDSELGTGAAFDGMLQMGAMDITQVIGNAFLYVTSKFYDTIEIFSIATDGSMTSVGLLDVTTTSLPLNGIDTIDVITVGGNQYLVTDVAATFLINQTPGPDLGKLTPVDRDVSSFPGLGGLSQVDAVSGGNSFLVTVDDGRMNSMQIGADGSITVREMKTDTASLPLNEAWSIDAFNRDGVSYIVTGSFNNGNPTTSDGLGLWRLNSNGTLDHLDTEAALDPNRGFSAVHAAVINGRQFVFAVNNTATQATASIVTYELTAANALTFVSNAVVPVENMQELSHFQVDGLTFLVGSNAGAKGLTIFGVDGNGTVNLSATQEGVAAGVPNSILHALYQTSDRIFGFSADENGTDFVGSGINSFDLGGGNDVITGTASADQIIGLLGNDKITAGGGADAVYGGGAKDTLSGEAGNDTLDGGFGNDLLYGGDNDDQMSGGAGKDILDGGVGNDTLIGLAGDDSMRGQEGADTMYGDAGKDTLAGFIGKDVLFGGIDDDTLIGSGGEDTLSGGTGNDLLLGGDQTDRLYGEAGSDTLKGDGGSDILKGGDDADILEGGAGGDNIEGGTGDDVLSGGIASDSLWGDAGNDTLYGQDSVSEQGAGITNDYLQGGAGADLLVGTTLGNDYAGYSGSTAGVTVDLSLAIGTGLGGDAQGDRLVSIENVFGSGLNDSLTGNDKDNILTGDLGSDTINGGGGNDDIYGGRLSLAGSIAFDGHDVLNGGAGNDLFVDGTGNDTMRGGADADTFKFLFGKAGSDTVVDDFSFLAQNRIDLSNLSAFQDFSDVLAATVDVRGSAVITVEAGHKVTILGELKSDFFAGMFIYHTL